jgi:YggT family protein
MITMQPIYQVGLFLTQVLFDLFLILLMLRFILQYMRVNFYHPVAQFVVKATSFLVVPVRRIVPGFWGIDFATLLVIIFIALLKATAFFFLSQKPFTPINYSFYTSITLVDLIISLFFYAVLIRVILSWVAPFSNSPVATLIYAITEPLLRRTRKIIPPIGGFDLSPLIVSIVLIALKILLVAYLYQIGKQLGTNF